MHKYFSLKQMKHTMKSIYSSLSVAYFTHSTWR
jgi:hypothetical protein